MRGRAGAIGVMGVLAGCGQQVQLGEDTDVVGIIDERVEVPAAPDEGVVLVTPDFEVPAYDEVQVCTFGTWTEADTAIVTSTSYQSAAYGHHAFFFSTIADPAAFPDGAVVDCTSSDFTLMTEMLPLTMPTSGADEGVTNMTLPDGMAVELKEGTRWVIQSHYVNPTADTLLVRDAMVLETTDPAGVDVFASTFAHVSFDFEVPPGETATERITCTWDEDVEILTLIGHMHQHGVSFATDRQLPDGPHRLYDIPDWQPEYRDAPPIAMFDPGELVLKAGDVFETACTWTNDGDHPLAFPEEMCTLSGLVYPARQPVLCFD